MYEKVVMKDLNIILYDEKESYEINIANFYNKTIIQDLKCLLYYDLNKINRNKKFDINNILRDKIILCNADLSKYLNKTIILYADIDLFKRSVEEEKIIYEKDGSLIIELGYFDVIEKNIVKPHKYTSIDDSLFELIEQHNINNYSGIWENYEDKNNLNSYLNNYYELDKAAIIEKYINNGMFELYYRMLVEEAKLNNKKRIEKKAAAMCSYLATKRVLNDFFDRNDYDLEVSNPNVFVKNNNIEYDALIIKKNKNNSHKFIFAESDVVAIIELKTSGYIMPKELLAEGEFIKYIKNSNKINKKFIYLSLYESFGSRDNSVHYYEYLLCNLKNRKLKDSYGIFCATKKNQKNLLIPYQYDLEETLTKILKEERL